MQNIEHTYLSEIERKDLVIQNLQKQICLLMNSSKHHSPSSSASSSYEMLSQKYADNKEKYFQTKLTYETHIAKLNDVLSSTAKENANYLHTVHEYKNRNSDLLQQNVSLQSQNNKHQSQLHAYKQEINSLQTQLKALHEQNAALTQLVMKLKEDNAYHQRDMSMTEELGNDVERLAKENEQLCAMNEEQRMKLNAVAVERNVAMERLNKEVKGKERLIGFVKELCKEMAMWVRKEFPHNEVTLFREINTSKIKVEFQLEEAVDGLENAVNMFRNGGWMRRNVDNNGDKEKLVQDNVDLIKDNLMLKKALEEQERKVQNLIMKINNDNI